MLDYEARTMTALGNARLTYRNLTIQADRITVDLRANTLEARGRVVLTDGGQSLSAEELFYDLDTEEGRLGAFKGELEGGGTEGTILLEGEGLSRVGDGVVAEGISVTTCENPAPHYHFSAARIEYYPDDRVILRQAYYWEGHLRLLYLPYLAISLRERQNGFQFPRFGYNRDEGLFLKLAYDFYLGETDAGALLLDLMQYKGIGEGIRYTWELEDGSEFMALAYHLGNIQTGGDDYRLQAGAGVPWGDLKLQANLVYLDQSQAGGDRASTYQAAAQLTPVKGPGPQFTLNYMQVDAPTYDNWSLDLGASWYTRPWEGASLALQGRWYWGYNSLLTPVSDFSRENYVARLVQNWPWGRLTILAQSQVSTAYASSVLPELTLEVPALNLGPVLGRYYLALDYQRRELGNPEIYAAGERLALDLSREHWRLGSFGLFSLEAWAWAKVRLYDWEDVLWAAAPELTLVARPWPSLRLEAGLAWTLTEGSPPPVFASDAVTARGSLALRAYYEQGHWRAGVLTGYAFATGLWQTVNAYLSWTSPDGDRLAFNTSYNPALETFGLTTLAFAWQPRDDWSFWLNAGYNPATSSWTQLDFMSSLVQPLGDRVKLSLVTRYDFFREAWTQSLLTADYTWHCRTLSVGYDWVRSQITLAVWINAFPEYPLKFAYSESGLYFTPPFILP